MNLRALGEECTLPMDIELPRQDPELPDVFSSPFAGLGSGRVRSGV